MNDFTHLAQEALQQAQALRDTNRDAELTSLHLAAGVLRTGADLLDPSLRECGVDPAALIADVEATIGKLPRSEPAGGGSSGTEEGDRVSPDVHRVLRGAQAIARELGDSYTTLEHLMLALVGRAEMFD